jgi:hypothetical protein
MKQRMHLRLQVVFAGMFRGQQHFEACMFTGSIF